MAHNLRQPNVWVKAGLDTRVQDLEANPVFESTFPRRMYMPNSLLRQRMWQSDR